MQTWTFWVLVSWGRMNYAVEVYGATGCTRSGEILKLGGLEGLVGTVRIQVWFSERSSR